MDRTDFLTAARDVLDAYGNRAGDLVQALPGLEVPLGGGSVWSVRDAAVHLAVCADLYTDIATGMPSPATALTPEAIGEYSAQRIADIPEADPAKVADMLTRSTGRFLDVTEGWPGDQPITWHLGIPMDLADLTAVLAVEAMLHGYDIAAAAGAPWPIDPGHALLGIGAYAPLLPYVLNPATAAGHTGAYGVALRGGPALTARFTDGVLTLEPPGGEADCEISADPTAFLLVFTGRLSRWSAIALGLISAGGPRPELALRFPDLFVYP